jgi:hypothetical protein
MITSSAPPSSNDLANMQRMLDLFKLLSDPKAVKPHLEMLQAEHKATAHKLEEIKAIHRESESKLDQAHDLAADAMRQMDKNREYGERLAKREAEVSAREEAAKAAAAEHQRNVAAAEKMLLDREGEVFHKHNNLEAREERLRADRHLFENDRALLDRKLEAAKAFIAA